MERGVESQGSTNSRRALFRKQLIIPTEHGSWSWFLVPYFVGVLVAGQWNLAALLVLVGGMAGFFIRQPATVYMRSRSGRGRKSDGPLAAIWASFFTLVAFMCLFGLMALGLTELLWLLLPMTIIFAMYLLAARQRRTSKRVLWMELAGAAGLASMAPAAYIAATGKLDGTAWLLWGLMAGQNVLGVFYVRLRIADTHRRPINRSLVLWAHLLVLAAVIAMALLGAAPWLTVVTFTGFLARAVWAVSRERPVENIKRFGFLEIGVEMLGGFLIALGWLI